MMSVINISTVAARRVNSKRFQPASLIWNKIVTAEKIFRNSPGSPPQRRAAGKGAYRIVLAA
jgi:hypothetical protein